MKSADINLEFGLATDLFWDPLGETEVELLLYFCQKLKKMTPSISKNTTLTNLYDRNILAIKKKVKNLHEDLQYDYNLKLEDLE